MTFFFDADNTDKDAEQAQAMIRREINSKMDCLKTTNSLIWCAKSI